MRKRPLTIELRPWAYPERPRVLIEHRDPDAGLELAAAIRGAGSVGICRGPDARADPATRCPLEGIRIGVDSGYFFHHLQAPVREAVQEALDTLAGSGASVVEIELEHIHGNISAQLTIESCEPSTYHQRWLRERPEDYGDDIRLLLELGELHLATHYLQAQRYRALLRRQFLEAFKSVDVFVCPTLPFTATPVGAMTVVIEDGFEEDMLAAIMQFTGVPSLTGLPSLALPCGFDPDGLPIGMQVMGQPFAEAALFRIGAAFQTATDFHRRAPAMG